MFTVKNARSALKRTRAHLALGAHRNVHEPRRARHARCAAVRTQSARGQGLSGSARGHVADPEGCGNRISYLAERHRLHRSNLLDPRTRAQNLLARHAHHWDARLRLQQLDLALEPWPSIASLLRPRHAITAFGLFPPKQPQTAASSARAPNARSSKASGANHSNRCLPAPHTRGSPERALRARRARRAQTRARKRSVERAGSRSV